VVGESGDFEHKRQRQNEEAPTNKRRETQNNKKTKGNTKKTPKLQCNAMKLMIVEVICFCLGYIGRDEKKTTPRKQSMAGYWTKIKRNPNAFVTS